MKSPVTRQKYTKRLEKFFDYAGLEGHTIEEKSIAFLRKSTKEGNDWAFNTILHYMQLQLDRVNKKEITGSTIQNHLKCIKLFCEMADIPIAWKKISRGIPKGKRFADDRIPTDLELKKLLQYPDRRLKAIICTTASSGIRLGAWEFLKWEHIRPIFRDGKVVAAKIMVYAGEEEESFSYISEEAYQSLNEWMEYRKFSGEEIDGDSWLMRDLWDARVAEGRGSPSLPKKLTSNGIKRLINRALWAQGLRTKLPDGKKRHPWQAVHSLRKWFKTRCELGGMLPINIELLLSHNVGISSSYFRPTEMDLLADYLKTVKNLTICDTNNNSLKEEIELLQKKNEYNQFFISSKLQERDEAFTILSDQMIKLMAEIEELKRNK